MGREIEINNQEIGGELFCSGNDRARGIKHHRGPIEYQFILATDLIDVHDWTRCLLRPCRQHRRPFPNLASVIGRTIDIDSDLGSARRLDRHGAIGEPDVFTNGDANPDPG